MMDKMDAGTRRALQELREACGANHDAIAVLQAIIQVVQERLTKAETALAYKGHPTAKTLMVWNETKDEYIPQDWDSNSGCFVDRKPVTGGIE
jgi:uncharacterized protein (DUF2267 family)